MKNVYVLITLTFLVLLTSCSSSSENSSNSVLIKKITSVSNGNTSTSNFYYNGNKLTQLVSGNQSFDYTYSGNNIINVKKYFGNDLSAETTYEYDNQDRVSSELNSDYYNDYYERTNYTYNSDNTISFQRLTGNSSSQTIPGNTGKIYNDSYGETYKTETFYQGNLIGKSVYTYDTKNSLIKNITGYNKQPFIYSKYFNNLTSDYYDSNNVIISNSTFEYTYNSNDFPVSCTQLFYNDFNLINTTEISYIYQ